MRTTVIILLLITNILLFAGCEEEQDRISPFTWSWTDARRSFDELDIQPGTTTDVVLKIPDPPYEYAFRVIAPETFDEENGNPLVYNLHGGVGGAGRDAHKFTDCVAPSFEPLNAFILSPNADKAQWYEFYNLVKMSNLVSMAVNSWTVDSTRMLVTGYSDGGNGTWFLSEFFPQVFSAGIAVASSYNTLNTSGNAREIQTPLYVIHSDGDELFPIAQTQEWVTQSIDAGNNIEFVVADGLSHYRPCDYEEYLDDAVQWVQDEVWNE